MGLGITKLCPMRRGVSIITRVYKFSTHSMPPFIKEMELARQIESQEPKTGERHCHDGALAPSETSGIHAANSQLEWPEGKLRKPSRRIATSVWVQMAAEESP